MSNKPGWQTVQFGDVVKLNKERVADPAAEGVERYVGLEHLTPEDLRIRSWGLVAEGTTFTSYFQPGQVLFGKRRAYQRKVAVADFSGVCSGDIYVLESKDPQVLLPELLPFICQTDGFFNHAVGTSAGSLSPRTNWKQLANYEFALPPLEEQRRIVDIMQAIDIQLESYRLCLISTQKLITSNSASTTYMRDLDEKNIEKLKLPEGWTIQRIGKLCNLGGGYGFRPKDWSDKGLPIIRIQNLNGSQDFNYYENEPQAEWIVKPGELLFAWAGMPGVSFGPCLWPGPTGVLNQHIYRVTPIEGISTIWLYHILKLLTPWIERRAHGFKKTLLHIKKIELTERLVPVPPTETQEYIAKILNQIEHSASEISRRIALLETVRHHILQKALAPSEY